MTARFRDRLLWTAEGAIMDGPRRYLMLRPDALMGLFRALPEPARQAALEAFAASVHRQGADSARAYLAMGGTPAELPGIIARTAPDLGWGLWQAESGPDRVVFTVTASPFAAGFGPATGPVCHPIRGMTRAVAEIVLGRPCIARETACTATGAPSCRFEGVAQ
ncbi:MAG: hypothetical protein D6686_12950 [Alphaproteobacteria bacterium]|nr:MAG: hypothetical protein D6686_12950 [Alphaproteobacteria bacterium]